VAGRFVDLQGRGIAGIIVRAEDAAAAGSNLALTTSDAGGNFLLTGLPAGKITLRIDATPANPGFPIWPYTLVSKPARSRRCPTGWCSRRRATTCSGR
jgi:hypothetical protein